MNYNQLYEALHYLKVKELRALCDRFGVPADGNKVALINCIMTFVKTGKIVEAPVMPAASKAQRGKLYPLDPRTLMLHGNYKNDAKTRAFFKKIIGEHFHYTAFGIDWLNERWMAGNPPTYGEFAVMWQEETERRAQQKAPPKKEWALIRFTQNFVEKYPDASRDELHAAWEKERLRNVALVMRLLRGE